jgi:Cu-Zn family superoxide dismutase
MKKILTILALAAVSGCATHKSNTHSHNHSSDNLLIAQMMSKSGYKGLAGTVRVYEESGQTYLAGEFTGLKPNSVHGFHIHETGDCSSKNAKSAGGHFNPQSDHKHGSYKFAGSHAGDLGNIKSNTQGKATVKRKLIGLNTSNHSGESVLNKSVVIHAKADDLKSQPSGAAGKRIGCGVLRIQKNIDSSALD